MTHTVAHSDYIITTIIIWINSFCLPLCPWITAVKRHVNDKDELWRGAERNWLWITRMQRLLQWCSYQSLCVRLCPDTGLSSLTLLISVGRQQLLLSSFNPGNRMTHHWLHCLLNGWGRAAIASVITVPSPFQVNMCPAKVQVDFIRADRRGEKWGKRHICSCVLSSCCHNFTSVANRICPCSTLLAVQGKQEMNECLPGFTARLEPLCYGMSVANLEGTRIGIVKTVMYAVVPPVSPIEALCCVNLPVAAVLYHVHSVYKFCFVENESLWI